MPVSDQTGGRELRDKEEDSISATDGTQTSLYSLSSYMIVSFTVVAVEWIGLIRLINKLFRIYIFPGSCTV